MCVNMASGWREGGPDLNERLLYWPWGGRAGRDVWNYAAEEHDYIKRDCLPGSSTQIKAASKDSYNCYVLLKKWGEVKYDKNGTGGAP